MIALCSSATLTQLPPVLETNSPDDHGACATRKFKASQLRVKIYVEKCLIKTSIHLDASICQIEALIKLCVARMNFESTKLFWVDDESDICTISSDCELKEAICLSASANTTLKLFCFKYTEFSSLSCIEGNLAAKYVKLCQNQKLDRFYVSNSHIFHAIKLNHKVFCDGCHKFASKSLGFLHIKALVCSLCGIFCHTNCYENVSKCAGETGLNETLGFYRSTSEIISTSCSLDGTLKSRVQIPYLKPLRLIGSGSFSKVYLSFIPKTGDYVALKAICKETIKTKSDINWLEIEWNVMKLCDQCPFITNFLFNFQDASHVFFVMEFVCGGDLMFHLQQMKTMNEHLVQFYIAELTSALRYLHTKNIIYRDLKLDNVLLDAIGHIKLTDFGMCKILESKDDRAHTFCGTPNYLAPEIILGKSYSFSVDWWALGVLCYELLVGNSPFSSKNKLKSRKEREIELYDSIVTSKVNYPREISHTARHFIDQLLQKKPCDRIHSSYCCKKCELTSERSKDAILVHEFLKRINWSNLEKQKAIPPFIPVKCHKLFSTPSSSSNLAHQKEYKIDKSKVEKMLQYFDPSFTQDLSSIQDLIFGQHCPPDAVDDTCKNLCSQLEFKMVTNRILT